MSDFGLFLLAIAKFFCVTGIGFALVLIVLWEKTSWSQTKFMRNLLARIVPAAMESSGNVQPFAFPATGNCRVRLKSRCGNGSVLDLKRRTRQVCRGFALTHFKGRIVQSSNPCSEEVGMAKVTVNCSWCHEPNEQKRGDTLKLFCWSCGHRADVPRVECDCRKCRLVPVKPEKYMEKVA
jgi:hypothetical protein